MEDVQSYSDERRIAIDRVGVRGLRYPITVLDPSKRTQANGIVVLMTQPIGPRAWTPKAATLATVEIGTEI